MKTAELLPPLLDYWVAKAMRSMPGHEFRLGLTPETAIMLRSLDAGVDVPWQPSTDPGQGQPIMERDRIATEWGPDGVSPGLPRWDPALEPWHAWLVLRRGRRCFAFGPTQLIAAMRAKVASVYGEEVPDA